MRWATKLYFCCLQAAEQGGETPIADVRRVYEHIDPAVRERFVERGMMLVRNFNQGFGLPWNAWLQGPLLDDVSSSLGELSHRCGWFQQQPIDNLWANFLQAPTRSNWCWPWMLHVLGSFIQLHGLSSDDSSLKELVSRAA